MARCKCLTGCAHSDGISSEYFTHPDLGRGLILRACELYVDSFSQLYAQLICLFFYDFTHSTAVYLAHIRKTLAQLINIGSDQWTWYGCRDMVRNQHKVSRIKISIETACRICEYQLFCAHHSHEACR